MPPFDIDDVPPPLPPQRRPARLPVLACLARHTDSAGPVEVARTLHGAHRPGILLGLNDPLIDAINHLMHYGGDSICPVVASFELPPGGVWVEVNYKVGILAMAAGGFVQVRRVTASDDQPPTYNPVSVTKRMVVARPNIDWTAVEGCEWAPSVPLARRWTMWCERHLSFELLPGAECLDEEGFRSAGKQGMADLVALAVATSPAVRARLRQGLPREV